MESNIINEDEIILEILPSFESLHRKTSDFYIRYKDLRGRTKTVYCCPTFTILELKLLIEEEEGGIYYKEQRLIFAGKQLEDHLTIADYNIKRDCLLHLVLRLRG